jgi:OmpA-OmpF porin, OOP family
MSRTPNRHIAVSIRQHSLALLLGAVGAMCLLGTASAQNNNGLPTTTSSADQLARTTPYSIGRSYEKYQTQRDAMKALIDTGKHNPIGYELSKSKCWLEVSFHEYTRNDRSIFPQDAYTESQRITQYLAGTTIADAPEGLNGNTIVKSDNPATQTLLLNNGQRLRSDLWDRAEALKKHPNYGGPKACGMRQAACAEVELAHAGNEINQQGWRHARPYIQLVEDNLAAGEKAVANCAPPPAPYVAPPVVVAPPPPPPVVAAPVIVQPKPVVIAPVPVNLAAEVLFNFDKRDMPNVLDYTKARLDALIAQVKTGGFKVNSIVLTGHADRSNFTGKSDYNVILAKDRAALIKNYMVSQGIDGNLISTDSKADTVQVEACQAKFKNKADFEACLLPNRRVVVTVTGVK